MTRRWKDETFWMHVVEGFCAAGVVVELALGAGALLLLVADEEPPTWLLQLTVGLASFFFAFVALTFIPWPARELRKNGGTPRGALPLTRPYGRVGFAVFFGYILVAGGVGASIFALMQSQPTTGGGLVTSETADREMVIRLQVKSSFAISFLRTDAVEVPLSASLAFVGAEVPSFNGSISIGFDSLDPPLMLPGSGASEILLTNATRSGSLVLNFDPRGGFREGAYSIRYFVQYNLTTGAVGNFSGIREGSLQFNVETRGLTSGWYLLFIFGGILMSFWWRVTNTLLKDEQIHPVKEDRRIAYLLLMPVFSAVIALVIFQQFRTDIIPTNDLLANAVAGFVYGFFWENATKKLGESVTTVYMERKKETP